MHVPWGGGVHAVHLRHGAPGGWQGSCQLVVRQAPAPQQTALVGVYEHVDDRLYNAFIPVHPS
jgi:hypothetical protein